MVVVIPTPLLLIAAQPPVTAPATLRYDDWLFPEWLYPIERHPNDQDKKARRQQSFRINTNDGSFGQATERTGKRSGERLFGALGKDLDVYGGVSLTARANSVSGTPTAKQYFNFQNNNQFFNTSSVGPFQQQLDMTITGKVFNAVRVNANLTNNRFAAQTSLAQLLGFEYESPDKNTKATVGDVKAELGGNELVRFSRQLVGVQFARNLGAGRSFTSIASITRGVTRRNSFQGQDTSGPYYLQGSQIIPGSEKIYLNGQLLSSSEYSLETQLGTLRFLNSRIITKADTVEYTYEALNAGTQAGVLTGLRFETPVELGNRFQSGNRLGFTTLKQTTASSNRTNRPVTQYFPVSSDLSSRYTLASPISPNTTVRVSYQERPLTEGIDYRLNRDLNFVQLLQPFPADTSLIGISSLAVSYTPVPQSGIGGDRDVLGFDALINPNKTTRVNLQVGQSKGLTKSQSGNAVSLSTTLSSPEGATQRWSATTSWRSVDPSFSTIESTAGALLRTGRSFQTNLNYSPDPVWELSGGFSSNKVLPSTSTSSTSSSSTTQTAFDSRSINVGVTWVPQNAVKRSKAPQQDALIPANIVPTLGVSGTNKWQRFLPKVRLAVTDTSQTSQSTSSNDASGSTFNNASLSADWAFDRASLSTALTRSSSKGRSVFSSGYTDSVGTGVTNSSTFLGGYNSGTVGGSSTNSTSDTLRVGAKYTFSERLAVDSAFSVGRSQTGTSATKTNDSQFHVLFAPLPAKLQFDLSLQDTSNGQSTAGYYNPSATTSGSTDALSGNSTGQRQKTRDLTVTYNPSQLLQLNARTTQQLQLIPGYDNTESVSTETGFVLQPREKVQLNGQWTKQSVTYVGGQGDSSTTTYLLNGHFGPFHRLDMEIGTMRSNFGSALSGLGSTGGVGTGLGGLGSTNNSFSQGGITTTLLAKFTYSVGAIRPFFQWTDLNATNPNTTSTGSTGTTSGLYRTATNYRSGEGRIGVEWAFSSVISASVDARIVRLHDRDDTRYSYRANTFNFDLRARFNN